MLIIVGLVPTTIKARGVRIIPLVGPEGSGRRGQVRTCLSVPLVADLSPGARRRSQRAYHFGDPPPPSILLQPAAVSITARQHRNPIVLAREWQRLLSEECLSRANLARKLGVSRARVTQVLGLLDLAPEAQEIVAALGDPLVGSVGTERMLRPLLGLAAEEQIVALRKTREEDGGMK